MGHSAALAKLSLKPGGKGATAPWLPSKNQRNQQGHALDKPKLVALVLEHQKTNNRGQPAMKGFHPLASMIQKLSDKMDSAFAKVNERLDTIVKVQVAHTKTLAVLIDKVNLLISEVSRYKNDSDELMVSVYAYCDQEGIAFSHGDLKAWGLKATRLSRRLGNKVESTNDPRFGSVNLYERRVLDFIFDN
jgi:hypothetical protein